MTMRRKMLLRRIPLKLSPLWISVFFVSALVSFIFAIKKLDIMDDIMLDENFSTTYFSFPDETVHVLRKDVTECLTLFSHITDGVPYFFDGTMSQDAQSSKYTNKKSPISMLSNFSNLISSLNIESAIIEPSILFCMITQNYQEILMKRNFNLTNISRAKKSVVTYGIFEEDSVKLQQEENIIKFKKAGFLTEFVVTSKVDWMKKKRAKSDTDSFISHIFYKSQSCTVHVVVFYERGNYLWHAGLDSNSKQDVIPQADELLFVDYNGAYEKFTFYSLGSDILPLYNLSIPSNPHYFLLETLSSHFLECNSSRFDSKSLNSKHAKSYPKMSVKRFKKRFHIVLHQLKSVFHPLLLNLWIFSGTMLGWYRQCDIIPYTTDVDFGAWVSEVENLDRIVNLFLNNEHAKIKERMGMLDEALELNIDCHGLRTDVFFLYQIKNGSWSSGHRPSRGYYFRYYFPNFTLCSGDLLGEKVQVPCETEKVILTEYGPEWNKPISKWNYQSSVKNRGPNIYWTKKALKSAFVEFN